MKESYDNMKQVLEKLKYLEYNWRLCEDCVHASRTIRRMCKKDHWVKQDWPKRTEFVVGEKNVKYEPLVKPEKVLLLPVQIKFGLMKQIVKALDKEGDCFKYLCVKFPAITEEKPKAGVFDGPQMRRLLNDLVFFSTMQSAELDAWNAFAAVVTNFLGNTKAENYRLLVGNLVQAFQMFGCNMSVKVNLHSHADYFPDNLGAVSEEQGEQFHQDIKTMENRYQGCWSDSMMTDYCWCLIRKCTDTTYSRRAKKKKTLALDMFLH